VKDIIIPEANVKDLVDIPQAFRDKMNFIPVKYLDEVLEIALAKKTDAKKTASGTTPANPQRTNKKPKVASPAA
jgi:ATP-dependent Lon protease